MFGELIPIVALSIPIVAIWTKHQQRLAQMQIEAGGGLSAGNGSDFAAQVQALEDRVRVLERIATDKSYDVAAQIEALREPRAEAIASPRHDPLN